MSNSLSLFLYVGTIKVKNKSKYKAFIIFSPLNSSLSLSFYHAEQETASLGGLAVSVFLWCKVKDNSFLFFPFAGGSLPVTGITRPA